MSVIQTQIDLNNFFSACVEQSSKDPYLLQCELICSPLVATFPEINPEEIQYELLSHGLFDPIEWTDISKRVMLMAKKRVWEVVEQEFQRLKGLWKGPDIPIYIYPINKVSFGEKGHAPTKNGVTYRQGIFLFLSEGLSETVIKAVLAHEYNHICRLNYLGLAPNKIPLKDSLIIEGFGEFAVKELYGEALLAPWTKLYPYEKTIKIWNKYFIPQLNLLGTERHQPFLYGEARGHLPKWIGYHIGYQIIDSYDKNNGPFYSGELYEKTSDELIAGSNYPVNQSL